MILIMYIYLCIFNQHMYFINLLYIDDIKYIYVYSILYVDGVNYICMYIQSKHVIIDLLY